LQLQALVGGSAEVIGSEATLAEAARRMVEARVDCLVVVDKRNLVGIITEHDLVDAVSRDADLDDEAVSSWMSEAPDTVAPTVSVDEAVAWLLEAGYRHLPVVDGSEILGIVTVRDLLWALAEE
jgi:CBS domain-containing protein